MTLLARMTVKRFKIKLAVKIGWKMHIIITIRLTRDHAIITI